MTRQVKPQAGIPMSTYYQEAFESLFVPKSEPGARNARDRLSERQNLAPKWIHAGRHLTLDIIINVFICIVTIRA